MKQIPTIQIRIFGRVQGVGFRHFVSKQAIHSRVTGWVKNCSDGSVEIKVQGDKEDVSLFIDNIKKGNSFSRITNLDMYDSLEESFNEFLVIR